jgi:hypothetical protein
MGTINHKDLEKDQAHTFYGWSDTSFPATTTANDVGKVFHKSDDDTLYFCKTAGTPGTFIMFGFAVSTTGTTPNVTFPADVTVTGNLDVVGGSITGGKKSMSIQVFSDATDISTGDGAAYFVIPAELDGATISRAQAVVTTAPVGDTIDVTVHNLTDAVDVTEDGASTYTVRIAAAATTGTANTSFDNPTANTDDVWRVDVDNVGSTTAGRGLILSLQFTDA